MYHIVHNIFHYLVLHADQQLVLLHPLQNQPSDCTMVLLEMTVT